MVIPVKTGTVVQAVFKSIIQTVIFLQIQKKNISNVNFMYLVAFHKVCQIYNYMLYTLLLIKMFVLNYEQIRSYRITYEKDHWVLFYY